MNTLDTLTLSTAQRGQLVNLRGGCLCASMSFGFACSACASPITLAEAQKLGFLPTPEIVPEVWYVATGPTPDFMGAVHAVCGVAG